MRGASVMRSAERMTGSAAPREHPRSPIFASPRTATPRTAMPRTATPPDGNAPHGDTPGDDAPNGNNRDLCDHKQ